MTLHDELQRIADRAPVADVPDDTWASAQRSRRRGRALAMTTATTVVALAAGLGSWTSTSDEPAAPSRHPAASSSSAEPRHATADRVQVTCADSGISVSDTTIAARPGGVAIVVSSSMPKGSYLNYTSDGGGVTGGDVMSADPTTWTLALAPGNLTLTCARAGDMEASAPAHVLVTDPHGYWRGESLSDLGCAPGVQPSWISGLAATGKTPEHAVDDVLASFTGTYSAQPAESGYIGAATQTWVATKNGRPSMTIEVSRRGAGFSAWPEWTCGPS